MKKSLKQALLDKVEQMGWWYNIYNDGSLEIAQRPSQQEDMTLAYTVLRTFQGIQAKQNTAYENC